MSDEFENNDEIEKDDMPEMEEDMGMGMEGDSKEM